MKHSIYLSITILLISLNISAQKVALPHDQLAMHLNKGCYFSGEVIWFKLYNLNLDQKKLSNSSEIGFIELINSKNHSIIRQKVRLINGAGFGDIRIPDSLSTSFYNIVFYTNLIKNYGEDYFCQSKIAIINPDQQIEETHENLEVLTPLSTKFNSNIRITTNKKNYKPREEVTVSINKIVPAKNIENYSISISSKEPYIFSNSVWNRGELTHGTPNLEHYPDYTGVVFSGKVANTNEDPIKDIDVLISSPDRKVKLYHGRSNAKGEFNVLLPVEYGKKDMILTTSENCNISLTESYWSNFKSLKKNKNLTLNNKNSEYIKQQFVNYQLARKFKFKKRELQVVPSKKEKGLSFYGKPHQHLKLDNYVELDSLPEYFYELIPSIRLSKKKKSYYMKAAHPIFRTYLQETPTLFVDGVYYDNIEEVAKLNHKLIDFIEVVPEEYYYKQSKFYGIVSIFTRAANFSSLPMLPNATRVTYPICEFPSKFILPTYSNAKLKQNQIPDLRTTLCWKPNVIIPVQSKKTDISFYTGDIEGTYTITVCGVNAKGEFVQAQKEITVKE
ncbi:hypothetical protein EMN47_04960 [Prolixibacteraceae bacterium JC049]|nr:hypothetical protein [Prolixibacteraceae bacterium JC049]